MATKIIVGVDSSERALDAIALGSVIAHAAGAELVLVNAYPYDDTPSRGLDTRFARVLREEAEARLRDVTSEPADGPVRTHAVADLSPARALQAFAEREGAELIVIGSSGRGRLGRVLAGTTAERLLHGAPCPVAVAPRGFRPGGALASITCGDDGRPEAATAVAAAVAVAVATGARLRIVEVIGMLLTGTPGLMGGPGYVLPPSDLLDHSRRRLAEVAEGVPAGVSVETDAIVGDPEKVLVEESERSDLVVVGSRAYGPHRAVLLGSVSGRLARDAACPVLVVPRGVEAPLAGLFGARAGAV